MSRSHFVLAIALVVIAATLVFIKVFPQDTPPREVVRVARPIDKATGSSGNHPPTSRSSRSLAPRSAAESRFDIGFRASTLAQLTDEQRRKALGYAAEAEAEARTKLAELTRTYKLTRAQQRAIFPIVAAHSDSYHSSMTVDGLSVAAAPAGSSLEESIHSELDPDQQALLEDAMLDNIKWWQEIANQLEDDLNNAIDTGELTIGAPAGATLSVDTAPAEGDGEAASHSGGNIFDLLNRER